MPNIILFDGEERARLLPLTYTRPVADLRVGILKINEKWAKQMNAKVSFITKDYLSGKYQMEYGNENYMINGSVLPSPQLKRLLQQMNYNDAFVIGDELIAAKFDERNFERLMQNDDIGNLNAQDLGTTKFNKINHLWDLTRLNKEELLLDFELLTKDRKSQPISATNYVNAPENIFLEEGAEVEGAFLNAKKGPIYIGKNAEIMEGAMIRGGFALCEEAKVKMGAKIYGSTTIGPVSKVGGEVNHSIILGYSNKGHDGYLGDSIIGEWCNLGADTNNSNLRNDYGEVKLWSYSEERFERTGQQFCGLIMGDHSKTGINTMFNTGSVVGVSSNIYGSEFPRNFIPSYTWGGAHGFKSYKTDKAFDTIEKVMSRRDVDFSIEDRIIMLRVFEDSAKYRTWEKKK